MGQACWTFFFFPVPKPCWGHFPFLLRLPEADRAFPFAWGTWSSLYSWTQAGRSKVSGAFSSPSPSSAALCPVPHHFLCLGTSSWYYIIFFFSLIELKQIYYMIFLLPINRSSSRSISKSFAACFNQELWCFFLLLWNSIFSICLAKFTRSC